MLESLAGTGHKLFRQRPKVAEKLEFVYFDPFGKYILLLLFHSFEYSMQCKQLNKKVCKTKYPLETLIFSIVYSSFHLITITNLYCLNVNCQVNCAKFTGYFIPRVI